MKRFLLILLAVLVLAGCGKKQPSDQLDSTAGADAIQPTEPGLYVPKSETEKQTSGAVRSYALKDGEWFGLSSVGADLLVAGKNAMLLLTGAEGWATEVAANTLTAFLPTRVRITITTSTGCFLRT